ncbi:DNA-binding protein [Streptomyces sp. NPDC086838]|jgi:hypothetical protein|uniref:DNA-binding protein n=1 Tax=Streptomyces sp. NPDC086838 TaxID=3365762 RepID=UPI00381D8ECA
MSRFTYPEAAEELKVPEPWLRRNIAKLPHIKRGRTVLFTEADIARIDELTHVEPTTGPLAPAARPAAGAHPLAALKPLPARTRRT